MELGTRESGEAVLLRAERKTLIYGRDIINQGETDISR